jgi:hypothetical protein
MFIAVNGMTLGADSHNGLFLKAKICQRAVFSKLSHSEDITVNKDKYYITLKYYTFDKNSRI